MRILYCMNCLSGKGGIERVTIVKANALADIPGNEIAICFTDKGNYPYTIQPLDSRIKVFFLDTPYWELASIGTVRQLWEFPKKVSATKRAIEQVIIKFKPDILINTGSYEKFACALISSRKNSYSNRRLKKFREFHFASNYRELIANGRFQKFASKVMTAFEKFLLSHFFNRSFLLTQADIQDNYSQYKYLTGKTAVQYNPCSFDHECHNISNRENILLAVGRVCEQKNFEALIEIWGNIYEKLPNWKLRIVGGNQKDVLYLKSICQRYNINESSIELPGWSSDIPAEMEKASVLCITSKYEGFPLVMIEAMHYGLPIVSWNMPYGPSEVIENGTTGYILPFGDKKAMADRLLKFLPDSELIESMRPAVIDFSKRFAPKIIAEQWMKHFEL